MSSSSCSQEKHAHIALLPSAGMGHLTPFLRFAASLTLLHNFKVTLITPNPTLSLSESQTLIGFFHSFPQITQNHLNLLPPKIPTNSQDPFYSHMERICQSSNHLLSPLLSSLSPPLSALITDMSLASPILPITQSLRLPNYILFTSSARMLTLFLSFHSRSDDLDKIDCIKISGLDPIPRSMIPPPLLENTDNLLKKYITDNGKKLAESSGILVNTFDSLEQESLNKLNAGKVIKGLPPVISIGPLAPYESAKTLPFTWLDSQPARSVVYVSFGSRTAMSREQLRELGEGLVKTGAKFLWIVKDKKVDIEDEEDLDNIIGSDLMIKLREKGFVTKNWVNQEEILKHESVGGFLSHCGWNSVMEGAWYGVPILAWPQHGDQKINADIVEKIGLGIWEKKWGWGGELVVSREDIAKEIKELIGNEMLRIQALHVKKEARTAIEVGGNSTKGLVELVETWKKAPSFM